MENPIKPPFSYGFPMVFLWFTRHWQGTIPASSTVMALVFQRNGTTWLGSRCPWDLPLLPKKKSQRSSVANLKETEKSENLEIWCKCQKISWFHMLRHLVRLLHTSQAGPPLRCPRFPRSGSWPAKWRVQCLEILVATNASQIQEILVIHVEKTKPWVFGKPRIMLDSSTNQ